MTVVRDPNTGRGQGVNKDGFATTAAVIESEQSHASEDGDAYAWRSITQALNAGETGLLVKNTDAQDLHFKGAWLSVDADTVVIIHYPTVEVTSPAGVAVAEVNLNTGKASDQDRAVAISDETTNVVGDVIWSGEVMAADGPVFIDLDASRLIKNKSLAIDCVGAVTAFDFTLHGHFAE